MAYLSIKNMIGDFLLLGREVEIIVSHSSLTVEGEAQNYNSHNTEQHSHDDVDHLLEWVICLIAWPLQREGGECYKVHYSAMNNRCSGMLVNGIHFRTSSGVILTSWSEPDVWVEVGVTCTGCQWYKLMIARWNKVGVAYIDSSIRYYTPPPTSRDVSPIQISITVVLWLTLMNMTVTVSWVPQTQASPINDGNPCEFNDYQKQLMMSQNGHNTGSSTTGCQMCWSLFNYSELIDTELMNKPVKM